MLVSRHYWIEDGESGVASAMDLDHAVPAGETPRLRYLYGESSDGLPVGWTLERPDGTVILQGFTPLWMDFGPEGFDVPGSSGEDVQLHFDAPAAGETVRGFMVGVDRVGDL